jgi:dihydroorotase
MGEVKFGIVLPMPFDGQVHVRKGEVLKQVLPATARDFGRAVIAPDTNPPITDALDVLAYRDEILGVVPSGFEPLLTIRLTDLTTPERILEAGKAGAVAAVYYPRPGQPSARHSFTPENFFKREDWFAALAEAGMVLSIHAEHPMFPLLQREEEFLKLFTEINLPLRFPRLRFILESISTATALDVVERYENVAASVTAHHLILTIDDVIGNHTNLCMPVPKSERHRKRLVEAVVQGESSRIFFASHSDPRLLSEKNRARGVPGLYTAPEALPLLTQVFASKSRACNLSDFVSINGPRFYQLPEPHGIIEILAQGHLVPDPTDDIIPIVLDQSPPRADEDAETIPPPPPDLVADPIVSFCAGQVLGWTVRYDR